MTKFVVCIPIAGCITIEVEAADSRDAIDVAWEKYHEGWEAAGFDIEWEAMSEITTGNVSHAPLNSIDVTESEPT